MFLILAFIDKRLSALPNILKSYFFGVSLYYYPVFENLTLLVILFELIFPSEASESLYTYILEDAFVLIFFDILEGEILVYAKLLADLLS